MFAVKRKDHENEYLLAVMDEQSFYNSRHISAIRSKTTSWCVCIYTYLYYTTISANGLIESSLTSHDHKQWPFKTNKDITRTSVGMSLATIDIFDS